MMIHHAPKILWIFVPGVIGAGATPTMYYLFGGKSIKELKKKYGETIRFGDLVEQEGWKYTTPVGVVWEDICWFWIEKRTEAERKCLEQKNKIEGSKKLIWLKNGREGNSSGEDEKKEREQPKRLEQIKFNNGKEEIWKRIKRNVENWIKEKGNGVKKCFKYNKQGIVFNWFEGWLDKCINKRGWQEGENGQVLFEKTAWLIASNAMNLIDSAIRVSKTKNDLALRFVNEDGRVKEIFSLGIEAKAIGNFDGIIVNREWIKSFGEAHRREDVKLTWENREKSGSFGWNPKDKKSIAFK